MASSYLDRMMDCFYKRTCDNVMLLEIVFSKRTVSVKLRKSLKECSARYLYSNDTSMCALRGLKKETLLGYLSCLTGGDSTKPVFGAPTSANQRTYEMIDLIVLCLELHGKISKYNCNKAIGVSSLYGRLYIFVHGFFLLPRSREANHAPAITIILLPCKENSKQD